MRLFWFILFKIIRKISRSTGLTRNIGQKHQDKTASLICKQSKTVSENNITTNNTAQHYSSRNATDDGKQIKKRQTHILQLDSKEAEKTSIEN